MTHGRQQGPGWALLFLLVAALGGFLVCVSGCPGQSAKIQAAGSTVSSSQDQALLLARVDNVLSDMKLFITANATLYADVKGIESRIASTENTVGKNQYNRTGLGDWQLVIIAGMFVMYFVLSKWFNIWDQNRREAKAVVRDDRAIQVQTAVIERKIEDVAEEKNG